MNWRTVVLLGVPFHPVTMDEVLDEIDELVEQRSPTYLTTANLDFTLQASQDVELQRLLVESHLVLCDGMPLIWASKFLKAPLPERVAGSDLFPRLAARAAEKGHRVFFFGADEDSLDKSEEILKERHPNLKVCGKLAPPRGNLGDLSKPEILMQIESAKPDILLVALGCPKQEKWISMNYRELGIPCSVGIGASFEMLAGKFQRAPVWMQKTGLEWVVRLLQEPKRLVSRYLFDLIFFVRQLHRERTLYNQSHPEREQAEEKVDRQLSTGGSLDVISWSGSIDAQAVASGHVAPINFSDSSAVLVDMKKVTFMDSSGLGLLLKAFKQSRTNGSRLCLVHCPEEVMSLLKAMKLDRVLPHAKNMQEGAKMVGRVLSLQDRYDEQFVVERDTLSIELHGEITASNCRKWISCLRRVMGNTRGIKNIEVHCGELEFIDSSGLGFLLQIRKLAEKYDAHFSFSEMKDNVLNVIRISRMEEVLLESSHQTEKAS